MPSRTYWTLARSGDEPVCAEIPPAEEGNTVNERQWCNVEASERAYKSDEQEKQNNKQKTRRNASKDTLEKKKRYIIAQNRDPPWYEPRCPTQVQDWLHLTEINYDNASTGRS